MAANKIQWTAYKIQCKIADNLKHEGDIECITIHGDKIYTGADDGVIKVWTHDLELVAEVKAHERAVYHLAVNNEGTFLYSCSNDGGIRLWHLPSLEYGPLLSGHNESVRRLRFSAAGNLYSGDEEGIICIWQKGHEARKIEALGEEIWDMALDGDLVFTARDRDVVVSLIKEGSRSVQCKATFSGRAPICLVNERVYFVSREGMSIMAHHNNTKKYEKIAEMKGHDRIINAMATSFSGDILFSGGYDNSVRVWDLTSNKCVATVSLDVSVNCIAVAQDGSAFVGGANSLLVKISKQ